jgi:flagellar protein FliS
MSSRGINAYRAQNVKHSSNEMIVLRLFEKALVKLWEAHGAMTNNQRRASVEPLQHCRQIFFELMNALDHDATKSEGSDLTDRLQQLYLWIIKELSNAGFNNDSEKLEGVIRVVESIYSGFKEAFSSVSPDT